MTFKLDLKGWVAPVAVLALCSACAPGTTTTGNGPGTPSFVVKGTVAPQMMPLTVMVEGVGPVQAVKAGSLTFLGIAQVQPFELALPAPRGAVRPLSSVWGPACKTNFNVDPGVVQAITSAQAADGTAYNANFGSADSSRLNLAGVWSVMYVYSVADTQVSGEALCTLPAGATERWSVQIKLRTGWNAILRGHRPLQPFWMTNNGN